MSWAVRWTILRVSSGVLALLGTAATYMVLTAHAEVAGGGGGGDLVGDAADVVVLDDEDLPAAVVADLEDLVGLQRHASRRR